MLREPWFYLMLNQIGSSATSFTVQYFWKLGLPGPSRYRRLAKKYHPDRNVDDPEVQLINTVYHVSSHWKSVRVRVDPNMMNL